MKCVTFDCQNQATVVLYHEVLIEPICAPCAFEIGDPVKAIPSRKRKAS